MGDIHGAFRALEQCLERSGFDFEQDELIQLGDVADGRDEVFDCVETLLKVNNLIAIKGNHDEWFNEFIHSACHPDQWNQGGYATAVSYLRPLGKEDLVVRQGDGYKTALNPGDIPESHQLFFRRQHLYYVDDWNNCFVHAGFDRRMPFKGQPPDEYYWNRKLWLAALSFQSGRSGSSGNKPGGGSAFRMVTEFREIFIGHTSTLFWNTSKPMHAANIWNLDSGAGDTGRLTIMDVRTKEYWQSDPVPELYTLPVERF